MPEPFKNKFNTTLISDMALCFSKHDKGFKKEAFILAASEPLDALELKARSQHIMQTMADFLPPDFEKAAAILLHNLRLC